MAKKLTMSPEEARAEVLRRLAKANAEGKTASKSVLTKSGGAPLARALDELLSEQEVINIGTVKTPKFCATNGMSHAELVEKFGPKRKQKAAISASEARAELLNRLATARSRNTFPSPSALIKGGAAMEDALASLMADGGVINVGTDRTPKFCASHGAPRLTVLEQIATDLVRKASEGVTLSAIPVSSFERQKGVPAGVKMVFPRVLKKLAEEKLLVLFKAGAGNFLIFRKPLLDYFEADVTTPPPAQNEEDLIDVAASIRSAYATLSARHFSPEVSIHELAQATGLPLKVLHAWLEAECRAHRAVPFRGEPTMETEAAHATALRIEGRAYYLIRIDTL